MFLKTLIITLGDGTIIRRIDFHLGLNLIVDETSSLDGKETGNNVGKTTVLKLIDYCLGASAKSIYSDPENPRNEYKLVKDFLIERQVLISLVLKEDLKTASSQETLIERNFLSRKNKIQRINGVPKNNEEFDEALTDILFPGHYGKKPTFRQIIAHNIRYSDLSISKTLKHLNQFTRDDEYETLYLFLLGCDFESGDLKQNLRTQISTEEKFKERLEAQQTKSGYETALNLLNIDIERLEARKEVFNLNPNFEEQLNRLNQIKYQINVTSSEIGRLELRKSLILEAEEEMQADVANIDLEQIRQIYRQASQLLDGIQRTFDELTEFHNQMVANRAKFVVQELPRLEDELTAERARLNRLRNEESTLSMSVIHTDSFEAFEQLIIELNSKYQLKGEYENLIEQINETEKNLAQYNAELSEIDDELFSEEFELQIKNQLNKFNRHFASVSEELYGEKYALKVDTKVIKGRRIYEFSAFNLNFSSGKKQGEITCFDIAYTLFADEENIPTMHFLLNDKKELMHDNQLLRIFDLVNREKLQFVASILRDKLPLELNSEEFIVLKLSQNDKLFRIEEINA